MNRFALAIKFHIFRITSLDSHTITIKICFGSEKFLMYTGGLKNIENC